VMGVLIRPKGDGRPSPFNVIWDSDSPSRSAAVSTIPLIIDFLLVIDITAGSTNYRANRRALSAADQRASQRADASARRRAPDCFASRGLGVVIIVAPLGVLVIMQVLSLIALMFLQLLALVLLVMAQLAGIAVAIMLFLLMVSEVFSLIPLVASLSTPFVPLMVAKIIVIVSTFTTEVSAMVIPVLRRSDRASDDGWKDDESYCESGCADQFGKS